MTNLKCPKGHNVYNHHYHIWRGYGLYYCHLCYDLEDPKKQGRFYFEMDCMKLKCCETMLKQPDVPYFCGKCSKCTWECLKCKKIFSSHQEKHDCSNSVESHQVKNELKCAACDNIRADASFYNDDIEQLAFELAFELEEAELSLDDLVTINREKLKTIAKRVYVRILNKFALNVEKEKDKDQENTPHVGLYTQQSPISSNKVNSVKIDEIKDQDGWIDFEERDPGPS